MKKGKQNKTKKLSNEIDKIDRFVSMLDERLKKRLNKAQNERNVA